MSQCRRPARPGGRPSASATIDFRIDWVALSQNGVDRDFGVVILTLLLHNDLMTTGHGWVSYTSGDNSHLPDDVREEMERRIRERKERQGRLLAIVQVHVYEQGEHAQVSFPQGALLGADTESSVVAEVVARARDELAHWQ